MDDDERRSDTLSSLRERPESSEDSQITYVYLDSHGDDDEDTRMAHTVQNDEDELRRKVQPATLDHDVDDSPLVREGVSLHPARLVPDTTDNEARDKDIGAEREDEACKTERNDRRRDLRISRTHDQMPDLGGGDYVRDGGQSVTARGFRY